jgi:hypothetical protein
VNALGAKFGDLKIYDTSGSQVTATQTAYGSKPGIKLSYTSKFRFAVSKPTTEFSPKFEVRIGDKTLFNSNNEDTNIIGVRLDDANQYYFIATPKDDLGITEIGVYTIYFDIYNADGKTKIDTKTIDIYVNPTEATTTTTTGTKCGPTGTEGTCTTSACAELKDLKSLIDISTDSNKKSCTPGNCCKS